MAIKPDDVIRLRNEGMAYALKIAEEHGIEELRKHSGIMMRMTVRTALQLKRIQ